MILLTEHRTSIQGRGIRDERNENDVEGKYGEMCVRANTAATRDCERFIGRYTGIYYLS